MRWNALLVASAALIAVGAAPEKPDPEHPIEPDARIQGLIDEAALAYVSEDLTFGEKLLAIGELQPLYLDDRVLFVRQAIYYYNQYPGENEVTKGRGVSVLYMMHILLVTPSDIVQALLPYIESDHEPLRRAANRQFRNIEARRGFGAPDFSYYRSFVEAYKEKQERMPLRLIKYMYDRSPGTAVRELLSVYSTRDERNQDVLWAEHVVEDNLWRQQKNFLEDDETLPEARAEVEKMAAHKEWWARLYAAEIVAQHPEFGTPEMIDAFKNDEHELVREAMIPEEKPKRRAAPPDDDGDASVRDEDAGRADDAAPKEIDE